MPLETHNLVSEMLGGKKERKKERRERERERKNNVKNRRHSFYNVPPPKPL
jgi:hypothetical protein